MRAPQSVGHEGDSLGVVRRGDAVLGHHDRAEIQEPENASHRGRWRRHPDYIASCAYTNLNEVTLLVE